MTFTTETKRGCATVAQRLRNGLTALLGIQGPMDARIELGMSLVKMGEELAKVHPNGHGGTPFHRSSVGHWEKGDYRMTPETEQAYLVLIERWITEQSDGRLAVRVRFGRRWHLTPLMVCDCGARFRFTRITQRRCPKCRRK